MNKWGIPEWLEKKVRERDKKCVYCGEELLEKMPAQGSSKELASWEHIVNDARIITAENIALCCLACNASKGSKHLSDWMQSAYCRRKGISRDSVADIINDALKEAETNPVDKQEANPV